MTVRANDRPRMLLEPQAAELLTSYGIPYVRHGLAVNADGAVRIAEAIGYPVVLKVVSPDVVHKTDVGGVLVELKDEAAVRAGYAAILAAVARNCPGAVVEGTLVARHVSGGVEMIVGSICDPTFGPAVMVGLGGIFAEAIADVAFRLPPLSRSDALAMLEDLRGVAVLGGLRGAAPANTEALADVIVGLGELMLAHPEISEVDLNPVRVSADGCVALDARIIRGGSRDGPHE